MQKLANTLKLPKIEDYAHKSQPYLNANKEMLSSFQHTPKAEIKQQKSAATVHTEGDSLFIGQKRHLSSDKATKYNDAKEGTYFINSSIKQSWILKKMEAQRETLQRKPQFLGLKDAPQPDTFRSSAKPGRLNQPIASLEPYDRSGIVRRKVSTEDSTVSKSVNFGNTKLRPGRPPYIAEANESIRKRLLMRPDEHSASEAHLSVQERVTPSDQLFNVGNRSEKTKFTHLAPIEDKSSVEPMDKPGGKVNFELILKVEEKLYAIFECIENKSLLVAQIKEYLELLEPEEVFQVETVFLDTRVRRNLKTYLMLEKTAVFVLFHLLSEEGLSSKETQEINIRNICHYMYSNFLNFADVVSSKLDLMPRFNKIPPIEKLKQLAKKKVPEIDRSFGLEQMNKLLLKVLKTSFKSNAKKAEQQTRLDLLLEKVEFGLMLNYFDELREIFNDLIVKHRVTLKAKQLKNEPPASPAEPDSASPKKKVKGERQKAIVRSVAESPTKISPEKDYHLPPVVPKFGQEDKPVYTLVLDMDETLIHFEEVAGKGRFFVRPHAEKFLKEMSELYEIVIFTAGVQDYADAVLNILDPNNYITHRLYRQHTTLNHATPGVIKDLSKIGRDLTKCMLIDNAPENFRLQVDNGLEITSWYNDPYDTELLDFIPFLRGLVEKNVDDVRKSIRKYKEKKKLKKH